MRERNSREVRRVLLVLLAIFFVGVEVDVDDGAGVGVGVGVDFGLVDGDLRCLA